MASIDLSQLPTAQYTLQTSTHLREQQVKEYRQLLSDGVPNAMRAMISGYGWDPLYPWRGLCIYREGERSVCPS